MRYQTGVTVNVAQVFETGRTVTVVLVDLTAPTVSVPLTAGTTTESTQVSGLFIWPTSDIVTPPTSYTEYAVEFTDTLTGLVKVAKIVLGGYPNSIDIVLSSLNDLAIADIQTALTSQGYTSGRAPNLDNLDLALSTLNDLSIADVQTALTNQGYTTVRAALLDNLDQALSTTESTITAAITALNNISVADILNQALAGSGETVDVALSRLDNMDTDISTVDTTLAALDTLLQGGRSIDFAGNDALGWQRVERNTSDVEVARYNLFDEAGARITGLVSTFISGQKMIAREVKI